MVSLSMPLSIWMQIGSFCFTFAGMFGDLMIIRLLLFLAYVFLFLNACVGGPLWPNVENKGNLPLDSLFWSIAGMYVHGASLTNLLMDEKTVTLNDDEAALWRMFYRMGGLSKKLFKTIVAQNIVVKEFQDGEDIPQDEYFYILYKGHVILEVIPKRGVRASANIKKRLVSSGGMFDIECLGLFHEGSIFHRQSIRVQSRGKTKLFRFRRDDMVKISHHGFVKNVWQALLIYNLTYVVEAYLDEDAFAERMELNYIDKIYAPLQKWELPDPVRPGSNYSLRTPFRHIFSCVQSSFSPPWPFGGHPTGIRHISLPVPKGFPPDDESVSSQYERIQKAIWKGERRVGSVDLNDPTQTQMVHIDPEIGQANNRT